MTRVTTIQVRTSVSVPFFGDAFPLAGGAAVSYLATVPGFVNTEVSLSSDQLTRTSTVNFVDRASLDAHRASYPETLKISFTDARAAYNSSNGITLNSTVTEV